MLKQVYRFLSIMLISNLLFSSAVFSKSQNKTDKSSACVNCQAKHKKSFFKKIFPHKKQEEKKTVIQKPNFNYIDGFRYGVVSPKDIKNTYPPQNNKN